ncbi:Hypothetical predicted protein, partial [Podarcis lilfordi]
RYASKSTIDYILPLRTLMHIIDLVLQYAVTGSGCSSSGFKAEISEDLQIDACVRVLSLPHSYEA